MTQSAALPSYHIIQVRAAAAAAADCFNHLRQLPTAPQYDILYKLNVSKALVHAFILAADESLLYWRYINNQVEVQLV